MGGVRVLGRLGVVQAVVRLMLVPRSGFDPLISTLKGWRPARLDDRGTRGYFTTGGGGAPLGGPGVV